MLLRDLCFRYDWAQQKKDEIKKMMVFTMLQSILVISTPLYICDLLLLLLLHLGCKESR